MPVICDLKKLKPKCETAARAFLHECQESKVKVRLTETLRTQSLQEMYYAQGRKPLDELNRMRLAEGFYPLGSSENLKIITNADGVRYRSRHQDGMAIDCFPEDVNGMVWYAAARSEEGRKIFFRMAEIAKKYGFKWGGDWKTNPGDPIGWDAPHFEMED